MTISARCRSMGAIEGISRLAVVEVRNAEGGHGVAGFTSPVVELLLMGLGLIMARGTGRLAQPEFGGAFSQGDMAALTGNHLVSTLQQEAGLAVMPIEAVVRRSPCALPMATLAVRAPEAVLELPIVQVPMAREARVRDGLGEGPGGGTRFEAEMEVRVAFVRSGIVAGSTGGFGVLPHQAEIGGLVVESILDAAPVYLLPSGGGMTTPAPARHDAVMGILMAIRAGTRGKWDVAHERGMLGGQLRLMARRARHGPVGTCEGISCLPVIEAPGILPPCRVMAVHTGPR